MVNEVIQQCCLTFRKINLSGLYNLPNLFHISSVQRKFYTVHLLCKCNESTCYCAQYYGASFPNGVSLLLSRHLHIASGGSSGAEGEGALHQTSR